jgi:hypothetical protein
LLILKKSEDAAGIIPILPPVETIQLFCAQVRYLDFAGGAGVRFIARYSMEDNPTVAENIFYTFQGITTDGRYYISAFYPIAVKDLPEMAATLTTLNFLNRLVPADFSPDLDRIDEMIKSLQLEEQLLWLDVLQPPRPSW